MNFQTLSYREENAIGYLELSRPDALNALNAQVVEDLAAFLSEFEANRTARCLIVTGAGEKAFVAGADIKEIDRLDAKSSLEFARIGQALLRRFENLRVPVIAAVNGFALGGGLELALACDFIVASANAKFGLPECTLGIMPGFGGTVRLPRRVGLGKAREMTYTGNFYSAQDALQMGLVNRVTDPDGLLAAATDLAKSISQRAPAAIAAIKKSIQLGVDVDIDRAMEIERELFAELFNTQDQKEGTRAFIEKRKPAFSGN